MGRSRVEVEKLAYSLPEAAEAVGYSMRTLQRAIARNDLVARYANAKPIILKSELLRWLQSLPEQPPSHSQ
ncbi:helix-turn-helix domain-containing protein [Microbacterium sp. SORGH_AS_0888]|uniref:helix-turn-helix domain-containing protein n=1 Tax=Microbacterium sp. SORGH_AS_0888 TaxID=3041791 RepID=UPI0027879762|nr:hypothetical protein [Microbacterium sp. SORGH_AS_0888]